MPVLHSIGAATRNRRTSARPPRIVAPPMGDDEPARGPAVYDVGPVGQFRRKCGAVVEDSRVQRFILLLIGINSAMIGIATFSLVKDNPQLQERFEITDTVVLVIFTIESVLGFVHLGPRTFFRDGWLVFDFSIVVISWASVGAPGSSAAGGSSLKCFRVLRVLRFVTRVTILRNIVVAIVSILPSIAAIFTLLMLVFYIYAVMFTLLFKDFYTLGYTQADYFGRMDYTLFTLFQFLCLDEWSGIAYEVTAVHYWAWYVFIAFIVMSAFVVINLLIAVICDALHILRTAELSMMVEPNSYGLVEGVAEERDEGAIAREGLAECPEEVASEMASLRRKVCEMNLMMDDLTFTQELMAGTIRRLVAERILRGGDSTGEDFCNAANDAVSIRDAEEYFKKLVIFGETQKNTSERRPYEAEDIKKSESSEDSESEGGYNEFLEILGSKTEPKPVNKLSGTGKAETANEKREAITEDEYDKFLNVLGLKDQGVTGVGRFRLSSALSLLSGEK